MYALQPGLSRAFFVTPFGRDKKAGSENINEMNAKALTEIYERSSKLPKKTSEIIIIPEA
jgi:hypothetical protein